MEAQVASRRVLVPCLNPAKIAARVWMLLTCLWKRQSAEEVAAEAEAAMPEEPAEGAPGACVLAVRKTC